MRIVGLAALLALSQCVPANETCDAGCSDAGGDAGSTGAGLDGGACVPKSCADLAANCGFVTAGCDTILDCGACTAPQSCGGGGLPNVCGCTPTTSRQVCSAHPASCGKVRADDGCGGTMDFDCGVCASGDVCNDGVCCTAPDDATLCASAGFFCGAARIIDACGQLRTVACGTCQGGGQCYSSDHGASCGPCMPEDDATFCERLGARCGALSATDNCGAPRMASCGTCNGGAGCGTSVANLCECLPLLSHCAAGNQCCNGHCGGGGLCCEPFGGPCSDDPDCCNGSCALGQCVPYADGGIIGNGLADDGGTL